MYKFQDFYLFTFLFILSDLDWSSPGDENR